MAVPNTFAAATSAIPLANLDANFAYYDVAYSITGTAISFTGAVTLSTGTANGVPYLNASKVLTSGTALTFDGTNSFLGIGPGVTPSKSLTIYNPSIDTEIRLQSGTKNFYLSQRNSSGQVDYVVVDNAAQTWSVNNIEQMRLTSSGLEVKQSQLIGYSSYAGIGTNGLAVAGNVGIGTSSPAYKLDVGNGSAQVVSRINSVGGNNAGPYLRFDKASVQKNLIGSVSAVISGTSDDLAYWSTTGAGHQWFVNNGGTASLSLDSSGNLGLGVTPSAWSAGKTLQIGHVGNAFLFGATSAGSSTSYGINAYFNGGWLYGDAGYSSRYSQDAATGNHFWFTAPSGTAGAAITFTQAMTLDASGRLGIGTSSPTQNLSVAAAAAVVDITSTTGTNFNGLEFRNTSGSFYIGQDNSTGSFYGSNSAYARSLYATGAYPMVFFINGTERMRLDVSGNLLMGTTAKVYEGKISVSFDGNGGSGAQGISLIDTNASLNGDYALFVNSSGNVAGRITHNGTTTVAYTTSSDYRLKNITGPITTSGAYIDSLKPVEGTWKADGSTFVGLIAHETQEASRTTVATGTKDGEQMQGMDYSSAEIIANLIAEIQDLRKRLAAAGI